MADLWDPKHPDFEQYAGQRQVETWAQRNPKEAAEAKRQYGSYRWAGERAIQSARAAHPGADYYSDKAYPGTKSNDAGSGRQANPRGNARTNNDTRGAR